MAVFDRLAGTALELALSHYANVFRWFERYGGVSREDTAQRVNDGIAVFLVDRSKPLDAFCIVSADGDAFHIDAVWCPHDPQLVAIALEHIVTVAREHGLSAVTFRTPRKGWRRAAARYGFQLAGDGRYVRSI